MEHEIFKVYCNNCGTLLPRTGYQSLESSQPSSEFDCPVCQFHNGVTQTQAQVAFNLEALSPSQLESELRRLLAKAHSSQLSAAEIVEVLRKELEFEAELGQTGRRILVQIIDLDFQEAGKADQPFQTSREKYQSYGAFS